MGIEIVTGNPTANKMDGTLVDINNPITSGLFPAGAALDGEWIKCAVRCSLGEERWGNFPIALEGATADRWRLAPDNGSGQPNIGAAGAWGAALTLTGSPIVAANRLFHIQPRVTVADSVPLGQVESVDLGARLRTLADGIQAPLLTGTNGSFEAADLSYFTTTASGLAGGTYVDELVSAPAPISGTKALHHRATSASATGNRSLYRQLVLDSRAYRSTIAHVQPISSEMTTSLPVALGFRSDVQNSSSTTLASLIYIFYTVGSFSISSIGPSAIDKTAGVIADQWNVIKMDWYNDAVARGVNPADIARFRVGSYINLAANNASGGLFMDHIVLTA